MGAPTVKLSFAKDGTWPDLPADVTIQEHAMIAVREGGTAKGRPTLAVRIDLPDSKCAIWYTSARLFVQTASLIAKRYPQAAEKDVTDSLLATPLMEGEGAAPPLNMGEVTKTGIEVLQMIHGIGADAGLMVLAMALAKLHINNPQKGTLDDCLVALSKLTREVVESTKAFQDAFHKVHGVDADPDKEGGAA